MTRYEVYEHWLRACPVATISSTLFFASALFCLVVPRARRWCVRTFTTPLPSSSMYFGALDSYRGLAACMVAFAHIIYFSYPLFWMSIDLAPPLIAHGGNKAVPIFVMLSGFLIYRSVRKVNDAAGIRDYMLRRFLRIYPLYIATTLAVMACGQMVWTKSNVIAEIFMLRASPVFYPYLHNPPAWSLYVEVSFYCLLPIFVITTGRWLTAACLLGCAVMLFVDPILGREMWLWKFFFTGILVSQAIDFLIKNISWRFPREVLGLALFVAGIWLLVIDYRRDWFANLGIVAKNGTSYTIGLAIGFSLVMLGTLMSSVVSRVLGIWPLRFLGTISYSIFLIHTFYIQANFPQFQFLKAPGRQDCFLPYGVAPWWYAYFVFFPGVLMWSSVTYYFIERPFLLMRPNRSKNTAKETQDAAPPLVLQRAA